MRDQPHDGEYWQAQYRADRDRLQRWLAEGKLTVLGQRRYRLR